MMIASIATAPATAGVARRTVRSSRTTRGATAIRARRSALMGSNQTSFVASSSRPSISKRRSVSERLTVRAQSISEPPSKTTQDTPADAPSNGEQFDWAKAWYPSDIASFCSGLYSEAGPSPSGDEQQVDETREKYNIALVMLELFERDAVGPHRGTQAERIASAGCDPDTFMLKLLARASLFLGGPYTGRRRPGAAAPLPVCCVDAALFARAGVTPSQGAGGAW